MCTPGVRTAIHSAVAVSCVTCADLWISMQVSISIQTLVIQKLQHSTDTTSSTAPSTAPAHPSPAQAAGQQATAVTSAPEPVPPQSQVSTIGLFQGLAINSSIKHLALHNLQPAQILQLAAALSAGGCAGALQQLNLQGARCVSVLWRADASLTAATCQWHCAVGFQHVADQDLLWITLVILMQFVAVTGDASKE